ncbi:MAG TPA: hypothetical protein VMH06_00090 [Thermodesulfovibrionales bacterium]|nr:hypothetical protein [Thermodesulfovibrionales bacterium]
MTKFDEIGNWSEVKLDIVREYAAAYSITPDLTGLVISGRDG